MISALVSSSVSRSPSIHNSAFVMVISIVAVSLIAEMLSSSEGGPRSRPARPVEPGNGGTKESSRSSMVAKKVDGFGREDCLGGPFSLERGEGSL